jgi:hypothetical protein
VTPPAQVNYTAFQTWSDGSSRDVTAAAAWTSTNPAVLSVNAGVATASAAGEVRLTAQFEQFISQPVLVRVVPATPEWNGTYTLTVGQETCAGSIPLPNELRQRKYTAVIQQFSLSLSVTIANVGSLTGQITNPEVRFFLFGAQPLGRRPQRASTAEPPPYWIRPAAMQQQPRFYPLRFWRFAYSGFEQPLAEVLPNGNRLVITGNAVTTMSPSGFVGTMNGALALYEPTRNNLLAVCSSTSHPFTLLRQ